MQGRCLQGISSLLFLVLGNVEASNVIDSIDTGWYSEDGVHSPTNVNYFSGQLSGKEYRNWFVFDLSAYSDISQATLRTYMIPLGYVSNDVDENWVLREISTSVTDLTDGTGGVSTFSDLGSGEIFGEVAVVAGDAGDYVEVELNSLALASMNSTDGFWAIGGALTTLNGTPDQSIFNQSHDDPRVHLVVNAVPVPGAIWLFGSSLLGLAGLRKWHSIRSTEA